jgi:hypothetical protein
LLAKRNSDFEFKLHDSLNFSTRAVFNVTNKLENVVRDIDDELLFDVTMHPTLSELVNLCGDGMGLFNSEHYAFLEMEGKNDAALKPPDYTVCPIWSVSYGSEPTINDMDRKRKFDKAVIQLPAAIRYGGPHSKFYGDTRFIESKLKIKGKDNMQLLSYLKLASRKSRQVTRGIIFDKKRAYLFEVQHDFFMRRVSVDWTAPGSFDCISNFLAGNKYYYAGHDLPDLPSENHLAILNAQKDSKVTCTVDTEAFLGSGAEGFVFRARREREEGEEQENAGTCVALKVVIGKDNVNNLFKMTEFVKLIKTSTPGKFEALSKYVVLPIADSFRVGSTRKTASVLFGTIGIPLLQYLKQNKNALVRSAKAVELAEKALRGCHELGFVHGDARIENVIIVNISAEICALWVDLNEMYVASERFESDIEKWRKSLVSHNIAIPEQSSRAADIVQGLYQD